MVIHKKTRLTLDQRRELATEYFNNRIRICDLVRKYRVAAPTVYKILHRARDKDYSVHTSENKRFRCLAYGLKRLSKIEKSIEEIIASHGRIDGFVHAAGISPAIPLRALSQKKMDEAFQVNLAEKPMSTCL